MEGQTNAPNCATVLNFCLLVWLPGFLRRHQVSLASSALGGAAGDKLPFGQLFSYFTVDRIDATHNTVAFRVVLAVAVAWVFLFLSLAGWVSYAFVEDIPQTPLVLHMLRPAAALSTTVLFLPLTSVLFRSLACPDDYNGWMDTGWDCGGLQRVLIAVFITTLLIAFCALTLFVAAVYIDRSPTSISWGARVSGRPEVMLLGVKLLLGALRECDDLRVGGSFSKEAFKRREYCRGYV